MLSNLSIDCKWSSSAFPHHESFFLTHDNPWPKRMFHGSQLYWSAITPCWSDLEDWKMVVNTLISIPQKTWERLNYVEFITVLDCFSGITNFYISFRGVHHGMVPFTSRLLFLLDTQANLKTFMPCLTLVIWGFWGFSLHTLRWLWVDSILLVQGCRVCFSIRVAWISCPDLFVCRNPVLVV